jgi:hypothetical protein
VTITSDEIRALCDRVKAAGTKMGRVYYATLSSGLEFRIYCTEEKKSADRSTVIEGPTQAWFLIVKNWQFSWVGLRIVSTEREMIAMFSDDLTFEIRGDTEQFLQDMALCRMFDDLSPNNDVRMAA